MKGKAIKYVEEKRKAIEHMKEQLKKAESFEEEAEILRRMEEELEIRKHARDMARTIKLTKEKVKTLKCANKSLGHATGLSMPFEDEDLGRLFYESQESLDIIHNYINLIGGYLKSTDVCFMVGRGLCSNSRSTILQDCEDQKEQNPDYDEVYEKNRLLLNGKRCLFKTCLMHICSDAWKAMCEKVLHHIPAQIINKYEERSRDLEIMCPRHPDLPPEIIKECNVIRGIFRTTACFKYPETPAGIINEYNNIRESL
jgi:hypothetical protein